MATIPKTENADSDAFKRLAPMEITHSAMPLPFDPDLLTGALPCGLRYYIKKNRKPEKRVALRLAVRAGSVDEEEAERGMAHMLEHLAFRATKNYDKFELVKYLESIGAGFGACQNAYTAFDETVYMLHVPTDKEGLLKQGVQVLHEWASRIRIADEDVEGEKGVVLEEWRAGRTAAGRMSESYWRTLVQDSKYADRMPIGLEEVIKGASGELVRGLYKRLYTLGRMAAVVVGDFESCEEVLAMLEAEFGSEPPLAPESLEREAAMAPPPLVPVPAHSVPRVSTFEDAEATSCEVLVECKVAKTEQTSTADTLRRYLRTNLFSEALNTRLYALSKREDAPFFSASASSQLPCRALESFTLNASTPDKEGALLLALRTLLEEVERVRTHGFSERELSIVKANYLSDLKTTYLERHQFESSELARECCSHFTSGELVLGIEGEVRASKALLGAITAAELQADAAHWTWEASCVVKLVLPKRRWGGRGVSAPSEAAVRGVLGAVVAARAQLAPWEAATSRESLEELLAAAPTPGRVVSRETTDPDADGGADADGEAAAPAAPAAADDAPDATAAATEAKAATTEAKAAGGGGGGGSGFETLTLSNGFTLHIKSTRLQDDELLLAGFARGGLSELREADCFSGLLCDLIATESGAFGCAPTELVELLAGKSVSLSTDRSLYAHRFGAECSPHDLESCLQLVHLLFTTRRRPTRHALQQIRQLLLEGIVHEQRDPYARWSDAVSRANTCGHRFFRRPTLWDVRRVDPLAALAHYDASYARPGEFTLVIVGAVDVDASLPLFEKWLASIPPPAAGERNAPLAPEALTARPVAFPPGVTDRRVVLPMEEPASATQMTWPLALDGARPHFVQSHELGLLCKLLEARLLKRLRFADSSVYSVSVGLDFGTHASPRPRDAVRGTLSVHFTSDPARAAETARSVHTELRRLRDDGPTDDDAASACEISRREHEESLQSNGFWLERLRTAALSQRVAGSLAQRMRRWEDERVQALREFGPQKVQALLEALLPHAATNYTSIALLPSKMPTCGVALGGAAKELLVHLAAPTWHKKAPPAVAPAPAPMPGSLEDAAAK